MVTCVDLFSMVLHAFSLMNVLLQVVALSLVGERIQLLGMHTEFQWLIHVQHFQLRLMPSLPQNLLQEIDRKNNRGKSKLFGFDANKNKNKSNKKGGNLTHRNMIFLCTTCTE
jgi:hypothetical protein